VTKTFLVLAHHPLAHKVHLAHVEADWLKLLTGLLSVNGMRDSR
jgi:hypothetical protein